VIVVGQEDGLEEAAAELGVLYVPQVRRNAQGTPLVSDIFEQARRHSDSPILAYVNADILLLPDFIQSAWLVSQQVEKYLIVGQRWDIDMKLVDGTTRQLGFENGWVDALQADVRQRGRLHPPGGSDYFIFPRSCFTEMPAFAIGRAGWDNWMFYHARKQGWPVINATRSIQVLHQDHDYSHLPGGQSHYRLPETSENIRLAGGRRTIFTLQDANFELAQGCVIPAHGSGGVLREMETWPLRRLPGRTGLAAAEIFFAIFHPVKAFKEWRGRLQYFLRKRVKQKEQHPGGQ
jgi:hypothetical protein